MKKVPTNTSNKEEGKGEQNSKDMVNDGSQRTEKKSKESSQMEEDGDQIEES